MAKKKGKKKPPPGGASGAPPRSEPRVQLFNKFAGCNFQLAVRDFDNLFDPDQDAQTDLMPMLMAIQNNASIAPFGGIETRQNIDKLFNAPAGKHLSGVATLIGDELFVACTDMTVHYGSLMTTEIVGDTVMHGVDDLEDQVLIDDLNGTYDPATLHTYVGDVVGLLMPKLTQVHTVTASGLIVKASFWINYVVPNPQPADVVVYHVIESPPSAEVIFSGKVTRGTDIELSHPVSIGDKVTMVVTSDDRDRPAATGNTDFIEAPSNDNTWTFLGYADDKLVGMTVNRQLWNGPLVGHVLRNAKYVGTPAALTLDDLKSVPATGGITIAPTAVATTAEPHRITLSYTYLNRFGPTLPSQKLLFYASKPSSEWTTAAYVRISGAAPHGFDITAVELYNTEGEFQEPLFLGRVNLPADYGDAKPWAFDWTGYQTDTSMWTVANLTVPSQNYTTGVPASQMAVLDGRLYFWGGTPEHRIWIGGNPGNRFSVSPGTGGGFVDVEPGTGTMVRDVLKFKTQQGAAIVTALCDNENSHLENRFNLIENNISVSQEQSMKSWAAEMIAGTVGCKSSHGAVVGGDGLYTISRYGLAITTLTMEYNSQLQVMYVSDPISPVFLKLFGRQLSASVLFAVNGVLYMTFGSGDSFLDNVIFCYDIALKAWWTYTLDTDTPILNMIHIDHEESQEGIGVITAGAVYLLPTTRNDSLLVPLKHEVLIETGELTTMQPLQGMHHLSQLELRFDYFIGDMDVTVTMIDQFGRKITTTKSIHHDTLQHQLSEYLRIDAVVESYKIVLKGKARMRMTHFIAKLYPKSNRIGMVWGFDSQQSHTSAGSIHRTFTSYNDLKEAIIP